MADLSPSVATALAEVRPCCGVRRHGYTGWRVQVCSEVCRNLVGRLKDRGFAVVDQLDDVLFQQARIPFFLLVMRTNLGEMSYLMAERWVGRVLPLITQYRPSRHMLARDRAAFLRACAADPDLIEAALAIRDLAAMRGRVNAAEVEDQVHALVRARGA